MNRTISADQIDFAPSATTPVISQTLRFVLPVPAFEGGGEPLVPPPDAEVGAAFVDRDGKPIAGRGVVFFNPDDRCYQAVRGDGLGVVLFSPIAEDQAERLVAKIAEFATDPNHLTLRQFKAVLDFARKALGVPLYDSTRAFVAGAMTRVGPETKIAAYGLHRRNRQDLCQAVYVPGAGVFAGPAATPQQFEGGAVIVRQGDSVRLVQVAGFEATYAHPGGRPLRVSELAAQNPSPLAGPLR